MDMVVFDHAGEERKNAGGDEKQGIPVEIQPLNEDERREQTQKNQTAPVFGVAQRHAQVPYWVLRDVWHTGKHKLCNRPDSGNTKRPGR